MLAQLEKKSSMLSRIEDKVNSCLRRYPRFREQARRLYQRLTLAVARPAFSLELADGLFIHPVVEEATSEWFFGYFGISPWNEQMTSYLIHRIPRRENICEICVVDTSTREHRVIGRTTTFNKQQGAMLRWLDNAHCHFNTLLNGRVAAVIVDVENGRIVENVRRPIFESHARTMRGFSVNPHRLTLFGEYGYPVLKSSTEWRQVLQDGDDGVWMIDLRSGEETLLVDVDSLRRRTDELRNSRIPIEVNHLLCNPGGTHLAFMQRWFGRNGRESRLWVLDLNSGQLTRLTDTGLVSHYCWRSDDELIVWMRTELDKPGNLYKVEASTTRATPLLDHGVVPDTHPALSPCGRWLALDSYPDRRRVQKLSLYDFVDGRLVLIAMFVSPIRFDGAERCDLHPRWSPDGALISVDASHEGKRMNYILDVRSVVTGK